MNKQDLYIILLLGFLLGVFITGGTLLMLDLYHAAFGFDYRIQAFWVILSVVLVMIIGNLVKKRFK